MTLLSIRDLHLTYRTRQGEIPAVRGVSLDVNAGETVGLAGESGCGKSSLASSVLRLYPKTARISGEVLLDGVDTITMTWGQLRAVRLSTASVVFQGAMHSLDPLQKIGKQLAEPILIHEPGTTPALARKRVDELLEQVNLPARAADSYPHQLSGGQKQRVMIALALSCSPRLIVADEPTTALDVMVQAQVLTLLSRIVRELDVGLVIISHDLSVLGEQADRVAVMYAGQIVEEGPGGQVFRNPQHPYTRALAGAFPTIGDRASRYAPSGLDGDPPDPADLPTGCPFHPRCQSAVDACAATAPTLEQVGPDQQAACLLLEPVGAGSAGAPATRPGPEVTR
jgi:peptide/nickel transport system ATP-binding protein